MEIKVGNIKWTYEEEYLSWTTTFNGRGLVRSADEYQGGGVPGIPVETPAGEIGRILRKRKKNITVLETCDENIFVLKGSTFVDKNGNKIQSKDLKDLYTDEIESDRKKKQKKKEEKKNRRTYTQVHSNMSQAKAVEKTMDSILSMKPINQKKLSELSFSATKSGKVTTVTVTGPVTLITKIKEL